MPYGTKRYREDIGTLSSSTIVRYLILKNYAQIISKCLINIYFFSIFLKPSYRFVFSSSATRTIVVLYNTVEMESKGRKTTPKYG